MQASPLTPDDPPAPLRAASASEALQDALRLALWRRPRRPEARLSGLAMTLVFAAFVVAAAAADLWLADGQLSTFTPYGLESLIAAMALNALVLLAFARIDKSQAAAGRLTLVFALMGVVGLAENLGLRALAAHGGAKAVGTPACIALSALSVATYVWLIGAARAAFKPVGAVRRPLWRGFAFLASVVLVSYATPLWPAFVPEDFDSRSANLWEWGRDRLYAKQYAAQEATEAAERRKAEAQAARREAGQHLVLAHAIGKLAERNPGKANVYTIGVAGWGYQDVFLKEIQQSTDILKTHFQLGERTLNLINNDATAHENPMASVQNFGEALRAVARRMDRDEDLLVLVLSSHGSRDGFALSYRNLMDRTLDPETLKLMLDAAKIKNRVVIVSSCYAGAFVAPLKNPDTMILTAADAEHTSFGCADDRRWTWFGEALFEKGLAENATLSDAFASAKTTIESWERRDKITASHPRMFVGEEIAKRFPDIVGKAPAATLGAADSALPPVKSE